MPGLVVRIGHLYPELNMCGDRGNVIALAQRCHWHGLTPEVTAISLADEADFSRFDVLCLAAGQDRQLELIVEDMRESKGEALAAALASDVVLLAVGGAYQALGHQYVTYEGKPRPGLGLLPVYTEPTAARFVGNVAVAATLDGQRLTLIGFENHHGRTYVDAGAQPFGRVLKGHGNNGEDGTEGIAVGNAVGTYMHGPVLPRNPALADHLLTKALRRRYKDAPLRRLDDTFEQQASRLMLQRLGLG